MKNKTRKFICLLLSLVFIVGLVSIAASPIQTTVKKYEVAKSDGERLPYVDGAELYAVVETEEEAQRIATLYDIELISFDFEVATYHTTDDPYEVVRIGETLGLPSVSVNTLDTYGDQIYYETT